jgi:hypothetical protein
MHRYIFYSFTYLTPVTICFAPLNNPRMHCDLFWEKANCNTRKLGFTLIGISNRDYTNFPPQITLCGFPLAFVLKLRRFRRGINPNQIASWNSQLKTVWWYPSFHLVYKPVASWQSILSQFMKLNLLKLSAFQR